MAGNILAVGSTNYTPKVLVSADLGTSDAALYTVAALQSIKITSLSLCNHTASAVTVSLGVVATGGSLGASHRVINSYSLAANSAIDGILVGATLGPGDFLSGFAGTGTAVSVVITGTVQS